MRSNETLKQCWAVPTDKGGGVIWVADSCCRQASQEGADVTLLSLEPVGAQLAGNANYSCETLDSKFPYVNSRQEFLDWVDVRHPDIVFLNNLDNLDACIPYVPNHVRLVYVVHDTMSFYWRSAVKHEDSLDAIVAVSEETGSRFRGRLKDTSKFFVIQNGTAFPDLCMAEQQNSRRDLVFLGGDDPRKGCHDLLEVWGHLIRCGYAGNLHWYGRIGSVFAAKIGSAEGVERIHLHGHVARDEVFRRLARSAVLLLPSRAEACSIAALEAIAMGCALVAWDIAGTGIREIVNEPRYRFLAPLGDCQKLATEALRALAARDQIGSEMARDARGRFSEERMWVEYRELVSWVTKRPKSSRPLSGRVPPKYTPPLRASQMIPRSLWAFMRPKIAKSARTYYYLRNKL